MASDLYKDIEFSKTRARLAREMDELRDTVDRMLKHRHGDGWFTIDQSLICFTRMLAEDGKEDVCLFDDNGNSVEIEDIRSFHDSIYTKYFEAANFYRAEHAMMRKVADSSSILDFLDQE